MSAASPPMQPARTEICPVMPISYVITAAALLSKKGLHRLAPSMITSRCLEMHLHKGTKKFVIIASLLSSDLGPFSDIQAHVTPNTKLSRLKPKVDVVRYLSVPTYS